MNTSGAVIVAMLSKSILFRSIHSTFLFSYIYKLSPPAQPFGRSGSTVLPAAGGDAAYHRNTCCSYELFTNYRSEQHLRQRV